MPAEFSPHQHLPPTSSVRTLTLGDTFVGGGGLLVFIASFLPFISYDKDVRAPFERSNLDTWWNAWRFETFMAPLTWFVALAGVFIALLVAFRYLTGSRATIATFSLPQLEVCAALFITVTMFGYATSAKSLYFGTEWAKSLDRQFATGVDFGIGGYLMLTGGIVALVGAILNLFHIGPTLLNHTPLQRPAPYPNPHAIDSDTTSAAQLGVLVTDNSEQQPQPPRN